MTSNIYKHINFIFCLSFSRDNGDPETLNTAGLYFNTNKCHNSKYCHCTEGDNSRIIKTEIMKIKVIHTSQILIPIKVLAFFGP